MGKKFLFASLCSMLVAVFAFAAIGTTSVQASPSMGSDCASCHNGIIANKLDSPAAPAKEEPASKPAAKTPATGTKTATPPAPKLDVAKFVGKDVTVTAYFLNVRARGYEKADVIDVISKGQTLAVVSEKLSWLNVKYGDKTGWVYGKYVALAEKQAAPAPSPKTEPAPAPKPAPTPAPEPAPAPEKSSSVYDEARTSPLGSRHWNMFANTYNNPADPEQEHCLRCHSAVVIVDDPDAKLTDFLKKGQEYCIGEEEVNGETIFKFDVATEDGKYVDNNFEGITCRVCHEMDKENLPLRRPDNTCTLCHGNPYNLETGSGKHIEQVFYEGHGDNYYEPSVHYTLGMQCQDCHFMDSTKHDYEAASPEQIVKNSDCTPCHKDAAELEEMIETTKTEVTAALEQINARVKAGEELIASVKANDADGLIAKAKNRSKFIAGDFSNGVHNPQFAAKLINEANGFLDEFDKLTGKNTTSALLDLTKLSVYSQAQVSSLGARHWDMLENTVFNPEDPAQDGCIKCHSAVAIVDDPAAKVADFLAKGQKYCSAEVETSEGEVIFEYSEATEDGKYIKNRLEGITCRVCHTFENGSTELRRDKEQTCGTCHGRPFNWETGSGKHIELAFFKGQGSPEKGIPDMPSMKVAMNFACQDCHFMDSSKHDYEAATAKQIAENPKCSSCHQEAEIEALITGIQEEVTAAMEQLAPRLEKAKAFVEANPDNAEAKELYTQAQAGVKFITDDFSEGVHNSKFARYLLERSANLLTEFEASYK